MRHPAHRPVCPRQARSRHRLVRLRGVGLARHLQRVNTARLPKALLVPTALHLQVGNSVAHLLAVQVDNTARLPKADNTARLPKAA